MSLEKGWAITKHPYGLVEKVTYQQNLISVPGKDASLDGEVKSAGVQALDFTGGPCQSLQKSSWQQRKTGNVQEDSWS